MRGVEFQQVSNDVLTIRRRPSARAAFAPAFVLVAWITLLLLLGPLTLYGLIVLGVGVGFLPWLLPKLGAAVRTFEVNLSHEQGVIRVGQEPLESARVETRVVTTFFTQDPKGYSLSLWVMFAAGGSQDIELGRFRTLLEVSEASWKIESFLAMAPLKSQLASKVR